MKKLICSSLATLMVLAMPMTAFAADAEAPSDVEGVRAEALNKSAKISWEAATDNIDVTGYQVHYGLSPVDDVGESFDEMEDVGKKLSYTVSGLDNGEEYFFAVVAYDAEGNESLNWSTQVSATPGGAATDDDESPTVADAEAVDKITVKVEFSEAVVLPEDDAEDAFAIENDESFEPLNVVAAELDEEDEDGKTVILTTDAQEDGVDYTLTVGIDIEDESGNPIVSGTSDTAAFVGSGAEHVEGEEFEVLSAEAVDNTHVTVTFNKSIFLSIDPSEDFEIVAKDEETVKLEVLGVELAESEDGVEDALAIITTSEMEDRQYEVRVKNVMDADDVEIGEDAAVLFRGVVGGEEIEDIIPPDDVAKFLAKQMMNVEKMSVKLTWEKVQSENADAVKQTVYTSKNKGVEYEKTAELDADALEYEVNNLEAGEYWFKLTQTDTVGNESEGKIVKVVLSETGPELIGLLALSLGFGRMFRRKK
ncbi:fibronectin type III domain-containing protein [Candidatus Gracilibacteria bacterium]|nr:fibronectin type III domain-containing protein [Candidatus Gracilibacteria bacterium]